MKRLVFAMVMLCTALLPSAAARAEAASVPNVIGFHGVLTDDGGNPLPDGEAGAWFRIVDAAGTVFYEEQQQLIVQQGLASALVGNGLTAEGAPTGGVPLEAIGPDAARYLEVAVEGVPPTPRMEIAAVPYAAYAQVALSAAEGAIGSAAIADGGIAFKDLAEGAITGLAEALVSSAVPSPFVTEEAFRLPEAAAKIGVAPGLGSSDATELQGALADLDDAIAQQAARITSETSTRQAADAQRVAKTGDTMSGALTMLSPIVMADGVPVDGVDVSALSQQVAAIGQPSRLSFLRSAWGSVAISGSEVTMSGAGFGVTRISMAEFHIAFAQPMTGSTYAATITPSFHDSIVPPADLQPPIVHHKTPEGFDVIASCPFDVVVMGF